MDVLSAEAFPRHDDLIFDIGMNICEDTDFYLRKGFRVVAVEADPASCAAAEARYRGEVASGQLTVLNRAISDTARPLRFYVCKTMSAWSTASAELRDQWTRQGAEFDEIEVPAITGAMLIERYGVPHYAKIDIEGFDLICLAGFRAAASQPDYVSVEVDFYKRDELVSMLTSLGYQRFALVGQATIPQQRPRQGGVEGRSIDHIFAKGCSGHFGDELPVEWVNGAELRRQCETVVRQYRASGALRRLSKVPMIGAAAGAFARAQLPLAQDWYDIHAAR
ncbi:MAG: FkbM family methyltransferase [Phenylobacterium sp.]|nr:FkbM family methyltransferase [Phenylobacterium sp.]MDB5493796.1 FkbM family methyltransferase [Phenylobacterium sp.]